MAFHSLLIFIVLLSFAIGESIAAQTNEELHWISVFPHTPMPKVLQDILPIPGRRMINNLEFGAYWDGENLDKESNTKNFPDNKGIKDPELGVFGYDDSYGKFKINDSPDNKGINDPEFGAYGYDDSYAKFKVNDSPDNKGIDDPDSSYGYASYSSFKVKDNTERKSIKEDSPDNKGVNDPGFGDFGYQYTPKVEDNSNNKSDIDDSPNNKGINDPEFGAYGYDDTYAEPKVKDNSERKFINENSSTNKGVNDPGFGDFGYQYTTPKVEDNSNKESDIDDSPNNKGINDPEFGAYGYDDTYAEFKVKDNSEKKFINKNSSTNKGVNDPGFGDFGYQYSDKKSDAEESSMNKESNIEKSSTSKGVNNPKTATAPNKKVNRKALRGQSRHENTATKETIYFFQETLLPGTRLNLPRLLQKSPMATFLPQQIAESLAPMSNDNLPQILNNFSLKAESKAAVYVEVAVKNCERDEMKGEAKYCATSLESFVDSGVSVLGKNIRLLWHELAEETKSPMFTIRRGVRGMGENNIVCHKMKYPYAVYLCHSIEKTEVYKVPLVSEDGTKANAMAACHKDTSAWSPNHVAFKILNVKPGSVPICHFFGRDTLVWIPN